MEMKIIKLLITIMDRGKGVRAVDLYRASNLHFNYICLGTGTANSEILDYFGLSETKKDVVLTLIPAARVQDVMCKAGERFHITHPGMGILFTVPLSGISGQVPKILCKPEYMLPEQQDGGREVEASVQYDLILSVVNNGHTDEVMEAARSAGAGGGTVIHARRAGFEDVENLLGFTIQPEKEIVVILTPRDKKQAIMQAINKAAGLTTESRGTLFSLPVDEIMGLRELHQDVPEPL